MIYIACDHAGFDLKEKLKSWLLKNNKQVFDCGAERFEKDDNFVLHAKNGIDIFLKKQKENDFLILVCGSGVGMSIAANRNKNIRAVLAAKPIQAKQARLHNNANCLCLGERNTSFFTAKKIVKTFENTNFLGGKYLERIKSIDL